MLPIRADARARARKQHRDLTKREGPPPPAKDDLGRWSLLVETLVVLAGYGLISSICDIGPLPGMVSAGIASGAASSSTPSTNKIVAVP